ncbi:MAG: FAD-binding protein [Acidobacteriota bacterium]
MSAPIFQSTGRKRWTSWHDFEHRIDDLINVWNGRPDTSTVDDYNATTAGFQSLLADALAAGQSVRAKGAGWSYTPVNTTRGLVLNTRPLNYHFSIADSQTHPDFTGDATKLLFAQGGNSIADLNRVLEARGLSLMTSGAANGQTIAGAMSTGTHGAAIDVGAVQDFVRAIHLVVSPDRTVWLERASATVTADSVAAAFNAELIRDDRIFDAALVSFGAFGIIQGVVIEATDLFFLQAWRQIHRVDSVLVVGFDRLELERLDLPRPDARPHHFQVFVNPFRYPDEVYLVTMYKDAERRPDCEPRSIGGLRPGDGALEVIGAITDIAPDLTPAIANLLIRSVYPEYERVCGTHAEIFTDTNVRGKSASTAMGIPLGRVRRALEIVANRIQEDQIPVTVALRYVAATHAPLGFTRHGPQTCVLEVDGPRSRRVLDSYRRIWRDLDAGHIPFTFHWGKISDLHRNPERLDHMYGQAALGAWRHAREALLPTPELRALFTNEWMEKVGLS